MFGLIGGTANANQPHQPTQMLAQRCVRAFRPNVVLESTAESRFVQMSLPRKKMIRRVVITEANVSSYAAGDGDW